MGPIKQTDAQNIQTTDSFLNVLHQLDLPADEMDTKWIEDQLDPSLDHTASSLPEYHQVMHKAAVSFQSKRMRAARRRFFMRMAVAAASLMIAVAGTLGVANAFKWNSFMRIFTPQADTLTFQSPSKDPGDFGQTVQNGDIPPPPPENAPEEQLTVIEIEIDSAQELMDLSATGEKAFQPLLENFTFKSGDFYSDGINTKLFLGFLDDSGNELFVTIDTLNPEYADDTSKGAGFYFDEGSQKNVQIGGSTVITSSNGDTNMVQWIIEYGYCHIRGRASQEELLNAARILLEAGLKPV